MKELLAFCGPISAGKSTLAKQLELHFKFMRIPFASPIKIMIRDLLCYQGAGIQEAVSWTDGELKEQPCPWLCGATPRKAMQTLGTEWRNMIDQNLWVTAWKHRAVQYDRVVVDDLRFPHEAQAIKELSGKIVRIERNETSIDISSSHESERWYNQMPVDVVIYNNSTVDRMISALNVFRNISNGETP